jgi:hypothetical protein
MLDPDDSITRAVVTARSTAGELRKFKSTGIVATAWPRSSDG